ncbi:NUDIX hydrolase [Acuticoccus kalidii]|uniref:NUDIX hydrolase n=1 Tax=Acuticoccus kalidii TaxID=2910977 RepID=UPI0034E28BE5
MSQTFSRRVPDGDNMERAVCDTCGFVAYDNPKIVVGAVVRAGPRILLCRRAIHPSRGRWTLPAGYLEHGETPEEGARREAFEEATADIVIEGLLAVYTIRRLGQVQLIYRARLDTPSFAPGVESQAVALYGEDAIPWDDLAFPSVRWALRQERQRGGPFVNPPGEDGAHPPGARPNVTGE